jgi:hypothetical protein
MCYLRREENISSVTIIFSNDFNKQHLLDKNTVQALAREDLNTTVDLKVVFFPGLISGIETSLRNLLVSAFQSHLSVCKVEQT